MQIKCSPRSSKAEWIDGKEICEEPEICKSNYFRYLLAVQIDLR